MIDSDIVISVVVPIYNIEEYLRKCIESIMAQTYKNLEIILVDDGSTDNSLQICDYFSKKDNRIKILHKANGGLVSARKAGIAAATGDYILNVDGDDWIEKNRIEILMAEAIIPYKADMIYMSGHKRDFRESSDSVDDDIPIKTFYGNEIKTQVYPLLMDTSKAFCNKVKSSLWTWAIRREIMQQNQMLINDEISMGEDVISLWFCLPYAKSITFIRQNGYHYVQRKSSLSYMASIAPKSNYHQMKIWYQQLKKHLESKGILKEAKQLFIHIAIYQVMVSAYELLLEQNHEYLYPFPKAVKGSKIIVYGAGRIGYSLMGYLAKSKDYDVVLWVDRNQERCAVPGYTISSIDNVFETEYDYIVIAILHADIAEKIKKDLMLKGISEEKIVTMQVEAITEEAMPSELVN